LPVAGRCRAPRAEAGTVVRPGWSVAGLAVARVAVAWFAFAVAAAAAATQAPPPSPWPEGNVEALPDVLVQALAKSGLIGRGEPVAAFTWTLEAKRPARAPRRTHERFAGTPPGAPAGLSPMLREHLSPKARPPRAGVSVRGLTVVRADDTGLDVVVDGLALPLEQGAQFQLDYHEDGSSLAQSCTVGALVPASNVHAAIPGSARTIDCSGRGRYHGIPVRVTATVVYLVELGVFLDVEQRIEAPVGRLRGGTRVLSFEMGPRGSSAGSR